MPPGCSIPVCSPAGGVRLPACECGVMKVPAGPIIAPGGARTTPGGSAPSSSKPINCAPPPKATGPRAGCSHLQVMPRGHQPVRTHSQHDSQRSSACEGGICSSRDAMSGPPKNMAGCGGPVGSNSGSGSRPLNDIMCPNGSGIPPSSKSLCPISMNPGPGATSGVRISPLPPMQIGPGLHTCAYGRLSMGSIHMSCISFCLPLPLCWPATNGAALRDACIAHCLRLVRWPASMATGSMTCCAGTVAAA
mmetsp:Transcript_94187/g.166841  ORF Transcript_94187/g.166841 Transcript_94187/m.166841 type:complete len:249 (-) Transcript_94187:894-1640(-)